MQRLVVALWARRTSARQVGSARCGVVGNAHRVTGCGLVGGVVGSENRRPAPRAVHEERRTARRRKANQEAV
jgi:hypothetical protein